MDCDLLFVYGLLREASGSEMGRLLARDAELLGRGSVAGRLYRVDDYPGAVVSDDPAERVHGEVYRMFSPEDLFPALDRYEECGPGFADPTEYVRRLVTVSLETGETVEAWMYVFNRPVGGLERIASGCFEG